MKLLKVLSLPIVACAFLAACSDDSSSGPSENPGKNDTSYDCSVSDGVKVVYPAGGETFKMGDTISIIYGADIKGSGFRFVFKTSEEDQGNDMFEESEGPTNPDGKTCYEEKVVLDEEYSEPAKTAIIRIIPYEKTSKGANSATFKVVE